jgi:hypothetical protein
MKRRTFLSLDALDSAAATFRYCLHEDQNVIGRFATELGSGRRLLINVIKRRFDFLAAAEYQNLIWSAAGNPASAAVNRLLDQIGSYVERNRSIRVTA